MEPKKFCQSCTMPIDSISDRGNEKDGSKSELYCKYCYQNGSFINPGMTIDQMKQILATQMRKLSLPDHVVQRSMEMLPRLKRWKQPASEQVV